MSKGNSGFPIGVATPLAEADNVTKTANFNALVDSLGNLSELVVELDVISADRADANETYDFYIVSANATKEWDIVHFPTIATAGAKTYIATVKKNVLPQQVTTASPGVVSNESGTLKIDTAGAGNGAKTLGAGVVRHGVLGAKLGYYLVVAGTTPSIVYSIKVTVKE